MAELRTLGRRVYGENKRHPLQVLDDAGTELARLNSSGAYKVVDGGSVTQATSISTGVTLSKLAGQITTVSQTIAAAGEGTFTVTNTLVEAGDVVIVNVATNNGNGTFIAAVSAVADGSFDITLTNLHASAAGDATLVINFVVIKGSSS